ncbi:MAG: DUF4276 family protein [Phycisphaeraceae bacterium]
MSRKLVLFGEGQGDAQALPVLTTRLLKERKGWDALHVDKDAPLTVGQVLGLAKDGYSKWRRLLGYALKRQNVGGVLTVLDGDPTEYPIKSGHAFCAKTVAAEMARTAKEAVGAGQRFSLAVVFARMEFESWLIAGVESLAGHRMDDGRLAVDVGATCPLADLEVGPRDAKGWLSQRMTMGYSSTRDQAALVKLVDLELVRQKKMRSFQRLEHAIDQLIAANRTNVHVCTP